VLTSLLGLALFALIGVGIRVLLMLTLQQRRERQNRQINERLKLMIAAYRTLGGSFTGTLDVDPAHLRDLRAAPDSADPGFDRARRIRDAVEAALSDIILLGTEEQVRLAERAARDLVEGRKMRTEPLVISLRVTIREALDLDPLPPDVLIPAQGPLRPQGNAKSRGDRDRAGGGRGAEGGGGMMMVPGRSDDDRP
jgi:hypothetical protein